MKDQEIIISASVACADFGYLANTLKELEEAGVGLLHFDIVDGSFAPTLIMGPAILASLRKYSNLPFEAHLACWNPEKFIGQLVKAGADYIAFHLEATDHPEDLADFIRSQGVKPVIALKPETPARALTEQLIEKVDMLLVLTVHPGFAGQEFIFETLDKIEELAERVYKVNPYCLIEADGNINKNTIPQVVERGARVLIGGSSGLFVKGMNFKESVYLMKHSAKEVLRKGVTYE